MKLVIVMRTDLNMRKGKMVAQGAHAVCNMFQALSGRHLNLTVWLASGQKKICVGIESEELLRDLIKRARIALIPNHQVIDAGLTEFNGVPTLTCCCIGPANDDEIDAITGALKLL